MGIIQEAAEWANEQRNLHNVTYIRYIRDELFVDLSATPGKKLFKKEHRDKASSYTTTADFIINAADLILGGVKIKPKDEDIIIELDGNTLYYFQVTPINGEQEWSYATAGHIAYRIHTIPDGELNV